MASLADLQAAVQAVTDGLGALGTSLTAEIAKLDALIAAGGSIKPTDLDPIVANLKTASDGLAALKTQADNAT